ncbi:MAG: carboxypeptidase-like regulatory domain-containing protein, partial [Verrucomicrobiales bacterium]
PALSEEPQQVGTISGHVYRDEIVPVEGARVIVYVPGTEGDERTPNETDEFHDPMWGSIVHPENAFHAVSDADGYFEITGIRSEGDARIAAYHQGFLDDGDNIDVIAGEERTIRLTLERGEFVAGVLLTESGAPVTDARLHHVANIILEGGGGAAIQAGYTDQSGRFDLPVGIGPTDRALATIMVKSKTHGYALLQDIEVCPEDSITLRYPKPTSLRGTVTASDDAPAGGFQVRLEGHFIFLDFGRVKLRYWEESTEVKPDGSYAFDRLDPKPIYRIAVSDLDGKEVAINRDFLELQATTANAVDLRVEQPAWVFGRVYGLESLQPIQNVWVRCSGANSNWLDDGGVFEFTAKTDSEGNYRIEVTRGWGAFRVMADYGYNTDFEWRPARQVENLEIRPGKEYNLNLPLPTPWSRSFLVQDEAGNPVPDVNVGYGGGIPIDRTDAEGRITLSALDPDKGVRIFFDKVGYSLGESELLYGKPGETFPVETIVLKRISGDVAKLVDGDNVAFAKRTVKVYLYSDGEFLMTVETKTDERGVIRYEERAALSSQLPDTGQISFELEIANPAADGQIEALYRSDHILLPEDETEDMGTIVLQNVAGDDMQRSYRSDHILLPEDETEDMGPIVLEKVE